MPTTLRENYWYCLAAAFWSSASMSSPPWQETRDYIYWCEELDRVYDAP